MSNTSIGTMSSLSLFMSSTVPRKSPTPRALKSSEALFSPIIVFNVVLTSSILSVLITPCCKLEIRSQTLLETSCSVNLLLTSSSALKTSCTTCPHVYAKLLAGTVEKTDITACLNKVSLSETMCFAFNSS